MSMIDMNDAEPQKSELIPDGTFAKVILTLRKGQVDGDSPLDKGLLKASNTPGSDVLMLDCEFTIADGPYARRKFWQMLTVAGGKVDEKNISVGWKITKSTIRAMLDSAYGLDPQDMGDAAKAKRILRGFADLQGLSFIAKIKTEVSENPRYSDSNRLDRIVLPHEVEWSKIRDGLVVPAVPSGARKKPSGVSSAPQAPAWSQAGNPSGMAGSPYASSQAPAVPAQAPAQQNQTHQNQAQGPAWLNG